MPPIKVSESRISLPLLTIDTETQLDITMGLYKELPESLTEVDIIIAGGENLTVLINDKQ